MLVIKESGTYTIRNAAGVGTAVSTGIRVAPGVHADITFAGVNIDGRFPMDIATNSTVSGNETTEVSEADVADKTYVHITLADGTVNTLYNHYYTTKDPGTNTTAAYQFPGLRCGEGSVLVIDDAVRNVDTSGTPITPRPGRHPRRYHVRRQGRHDKDVHGQGFRPRLEPLEPREPEPWHALGLQRHPLGGHRRRPRGELRRHDLQRRRHPCLCPGPRRRRWRSQWQRLRLRHRRRPCRRRHHHHLQRRHRGRPGILPRCSHRRRLHLHRRHVDERRELPPCATRSSPAPPTTPSPATSPSTAVTSRPKGTTTPTPSGKAVAVPMPARPSSSPAERWSPAGAATPRSSRSAATRATS